ncbi:hypothetical protein IV203_013617 [Nitzschia inconspicua]|uniref:Uncharacterized protein n=1 Tax=Nitzschia inconspicua TaxID=303405 RepID=A0A9K3M5U4_9STRA|nr:hypothetical protein IV203_013617 [Nitzschia inconspicua]
MERFTPSARLNFIVAALRNLTKSDHSPSYFKKGSECRMKLPVFPLTETLVMLDDKVTSWFPWRGNDISRSLSICVPKRAHADAYVNVHSEFASILFGCNTNVITGVDGGSVMYCTCCISKNTEREDNKHFADAAKHMVKNMQQQMAEKKGLSDVELEEEASSVGFKGMIGTALKVHIKWLHLWHHISSEMGPDSISRMIFHMLTLVVSSKPSKISTFQKMRIVLFDDFKLRVPPQGIRGGVCLRL